MIDKLIEFLLKQFWCKNNKHLYLAFWHGLPSKIDNVHITCYGCGKDLAGGTFVDIDHVKEYRL